MEGESSESPKGCKVRQERVLGEAQEDKEQEREKTGKDQGPKKGRKPGERGMKDGKY